MGGLGVSSATLLALPALWPQLLMRVIFYDDFLGNIRRCFVYEEKWLSVTNEQECPIDGNGTHKNWTQPVYVKTARDLISRMDNKRSNVFNAHQGIFETQ